MAAPVVHSVVAPLSLDEAKAHIATIDTKGHYDSATDMEFWIAALHYEGEDAVPAGILPGVLDHEWSLLSDPKSGFAYYLRWYGLVRIKGGKERGWQRFCPDGMPRVHPETGRDWSWQLLLAESLPSYEMFLVLKARQIGLTFLAANYAEWKCLFFPDTVGIIIANKMPTSQRLARRVRDIHRRLPIWIVERVPMTADGLSRFEWENGSALEPMSAASDTGRSEAANFVLIDETANIRPIAKQEEVWASVEACADDGGQIIMFSTANGVGDLFHGWVVDSMMGDVQHVLDLGWDDGTTVDIQYGDAEMGFVFLPYYLHPARDTAWREKKRRVYRGSLAKFEQEYPETVEQAFIASGLNYFSIVHVEEIAHALRRKAPERDVTGHLVWKDKSTLSVDFVPDPFGFITVHGLEETEAARESGFAFVIGADCAGDDPWGDFQAASALCVGQPFCDFTEEELLPEGVMIPHKQLVTIHGQMPADAYAESLEKMGYWLNHAVLGIEANGVGAAVINNLKRLRYPRLYMRRTRPTARNEKATSTIGWHSSSATKNMAFGLLDKYLRTGAVEIRDIDTLDEMRGVVHLGGSRLGAPEPRHDDRPNGLAVACAIARGESARAILRGHEDNDPILAVLEEIEREALAQELTLGNERYYGR